MQIGDWAALYAAVLSTLLALASFIAWIRSGPRLSVTVFNPIEASIGGSSALLAIISNTGDVPTVVRKVEISFRTKKGGGATEIANAVFDESSTWKPAVKLVPVENKTNTVREEPNVIPPNGEIRAPAKAVPTYDVSCHWIRVTAWARNSDRSFVGWAAPATSSSNGGATS